MILHLGRKILTRFSVAQKYLMLRTLFPKYVLRTPITNKTYGAANSVVIFCWDAVHEPAFCVWGNHGDWFLRQFHGCSGIPVTSSPVTPHQDNYADFSWQLSPSLFHWLFSLSSVQFSSVQFNPPFRAVIWSIWLGGNGLLRTLEEENHGQRAIWRQKPVPSCSLQGPGKTTDESPDVRSLKV